MHEEKVCDCNNTKLSDDESYNLDNKDLSVEDVINFLERLCVSSQLGLLIQFSGYDAYLTIDTTVWLMDHVIIRKEGLSEHPEVVLVR